MLALGFQLVEPGGGAGQVLPERREEERADAERARTDAAEARYREVVNRPQVVIVAPPALWRPEDWRHPQYQIGAQSGAQDNMGYDVGWGMYTDPFGERTYHDGAGWRWVLP